MQAGDLYAGGFGLNFFASPEFEMEDPGDPTNNSVILGRNLLRVMMMGWHDDWANLVSRDVLKSILINREPKLMQGFRRAFQEGFNHVFSQLENVDLTQEEHNQAQLFINNCLMFLSYADPNPYEAIAIPQWVNGSWQMVDYKVTPIELTPTSGFKKLFIAEEDRVFAYGLEPIMNADAEPHLIFMGTTYPGGQGFFSTIKTDLEAFETAGKNLYRTGHENIKRWLNLQSKKVHVVGTSLGGALALLLATDQGDKLSRVDALNPPGLYRPFFRKSVFDNWDELSEQPEVYIQRQGKDPVSQFGVWKKEWNLLHVIPGDPKLGGNRFIDHAINYAGFADTRFKLLDTEKQNRKNERRTFWIYTLLRSFAYYTLVVPFYYVVRPIVRIILTHKVQTALTLPLMFFSSLLMSATMIPSAVFAVGAVGYLLSSLLTFLYDQITGSKYSDVSKFLDTLRKTNAVLEVSAVLGAVAVLTAINVISLTVIISLPFVFSILKDMVHLTKVVLGYHEEKSSPCHDPSLISNPKMDIHKNQMEALFTKEEIFHYHVATAILKEDMISLEQENPSTHEETIAYSASQAEIHHIKHMAKLGHLATRFGFYGVKDEIDKSYDEYIKGCSHN